MLNKLIKILLVEDSRAQATYIQDAIIENASNQIDIEWADSLSKGLQYCDEFEFDVILLDLMLPDSDGLATFSSMFKKVPLTPIIILSGTADERLAVNAVQMGAQDYFVKANMDPHAIIRSILYGIERKKMEKKLRKSEKRYHDLFDNAPVPLREEDYSQVKQYIDELTKQGVEDFANYFCNNRIKVVHLIQQVKIIDVNQAELTLYEAKTKVDLLNGLSTIFTEETINNFIELLEVIANSKIEYKSEVAIRTLTDKKKYIFLKWFVAPGHENCYSKVFVSAYDITDRKNAEKALRQSEEKYRTLFEESKDVVLITTPRGRILDINWAGIQFFGYESKEQILGINIINKIYSNPKDRKTYKQRMKIDGFVKDFELVLKRKDGKLLNVLETSTAIKDENDRIVAFRGIIRDVTDRVNNENLLREANEKLKVSYEELKQAQSTLVQQEKLASIGHLAAGVAHELNNPLGFIANNFTTLKSYMRCINEYLIHFNELKTLVRSLDDSQLSEILLKIETFKKKKKIEYIFEDLQDLFEESSKGFERIVSIVQGLRNFSRVDSLNEVELYDINEAINDTLIVAMNQVKYVAKVEKEYTNVPGIECKGSEINQVLLNVIINAAQAIESQKRKELGTIKIRTFKDDSCVICEISDNGPGIPSEIQGKIFDPFFTTKEVGKGTGLGLSLSYDIIVNKHKGEFKVISEIGKGATFYIKLPIIHQMKMKEMFERKNNEQVLEKAFLFSSK